MVHNLYPCRLKRSSDGLKVISNLIISISSSERSERLCPSPCHAIEETCKPEFQFLKESKEFIQNVVQTSADMFPLQMYLQIFLLFPHPLSNLPVWGLCSKNAIKITMTPVFVFKIPWHFCGHTHSPRGHMYL